MKKIIYTFIIALLCSSCNKDITGDEVLTTVDYTVEQSSSTISISSNMELILSSELEVGELEITANENIHQYIKLINDSDKLTVDLESNSYSSIEIVIKASSLQYSSFICSGVSEVRVEGEPVAFADCNIEVSGSAKVTLAGDAQICKITASGMGEVNGPDFSIEELTVDLSGSSSALLIVNQSISGKMSGASKLEYSGSATQELTMTGSSKIEKI